MCLKTNKIVTEKTKKNEGSLSLTKNKGEDEIVNLTTPKSDGVGLKTPLETVMLSKKSNWVVNKPDSIFSLLHKQCPGRE